MLSMARKILLAVLAMASRVLAKIRVTSWVQNVSWQTRSHTRLQNALLHPVVHALDDNPETHTEFAGVKGWLILVRSWSHSLDSLPRFSSATC